MKKQFRNPPPAQPVVNALGRLVYEPSAWRHELGLFGGRAARYKQSRQGLVRAFDPVRMCNVALRKPIHFEFWLTLFLDPEVGEIEIYPAPLKIMEEGRTQACGYHFAWCSLLDGENHLVWVEEQDEDVEAISKLHKIAALHKYRLHVVTKNWIRKQQVFVDNCDRARRVMTALLGCNYMSRKDQVIEACRVGPMTRGHLLGSKFLIEEELDYLLFWLYRQGIVQLDLTGCVYGDHIHVSLK